MQPARIAELLAPFLNPLGTSPNPCHSEHAQSAGEEPAVLPTKTLDNISTYIDMLVRWNARINLTAIRDPEEIVTRHFGESLFAARHLFPPRGEAGAPVRPAEQSSAPEATDLTTAWKSGASAPRQANQKEGASAPAETLRLADLGSGAGFPGIPIKLYAPEISLTLIESNHKKSAFLREIARALTLTDVNIQNTRAEALDPKLHHSLDVVTLRAVERFDQILPTAATLLAPNARLALLIGASQLTPAHTTLPTLTWSDPLPIPNSQSRVLLIGRSPA